MKTAGMILASAALLYLDIAGHYMDSVGIVDLSKNRIELDIQLELIRPGCAAVIVTDSALVAEKVIRAAEKHKVLLLTSPQPACSTVKLITMLEPVSSIMTERCPAAGLYTPMSAVRKKIIESDYRSVIVVDIENRLIGFITRPALLILNPLGKAEEFIFLRGETWLVEKAFNVKVQNDSCIVDRVMLRKKDFIPAIGQVLGMVHIN